MLTLNTRYTLEAPQGSITHAGIREISRFIQMQRLSEGEWKEKNPSAPRTYLPSLPSDWQWVWVVTGRGEYVGTFPKRVSKYLYKVHSLKAPARFLQEIGNIARRHTEDNIAYEYEFVNEFDWQAGDFGDRGSCFWGSNSEARRVMSENGGLAIRFYEDGSGIARAWVAPIRDDLYIVFNGYGFPAYPTLTCARVLSLHLGVSYKKIYVTNHGHDSGLLYINNGSGFLVGPAESIDSRRSYDFEWGPENHCHDCGDEVNQNHAYYGPDGEGVYCEVCFYDRYEYCQRCDDTVNREEVYIIANGEEYVCENCYERHYTRCDGCDVDFRQSDTTTVDDHDYCEDCLPDQTYVCEHCEEVHRNEVMCECRNK